MTSSHDWCDCIYSINVGILTPFLQHPPLFLPCHVCRGQGASTRLKGNWLRPRVFSAAAFSRCHKWRKSCKTEALDHSCADFCCRACLIFTANLSTAATFATLCLKRRQLRANYQPPPRPLMLPLCLNIAIHT